MVNNITQTILNMATGVVPLVPIVMGLTQWVKVTYHTSDATILNVCSMAFGLLFGTGYMIAIQLPVDFAGWFIVVVYGVVLGLTASGLWKVGAEMADKSAALARVATTTTTTETTVDAKPVAAVVPPLVETVNERYQPPIKRQGG